MSKLLVVLCFLPFLGCGPMGPIPGGSLSGRVQAIPEDWSAARDIDIVQIETRPDDPYSINIWGVAVGKDFFIASGEGAESAWVEHLTQNPLVKLRIGKSVYPLKAVRVEDEDELLRVGERYSEKYDLESEESSADKVWIFRLDRR